MSTPDFDGDGDYDLVVSSFDEDDSVCVVWLFENTGTASYPLFETSMILQTVSCTGPLTLASPVLSATPKWWIELPHRFWLPDSGVTSNGGTHTIPFQLTFTGVSQDQVFDTLVLNNGADTQNTMEALSTLGLVMNARTSHCLNQRRMLFLARVIIKIDLKRQASGWTSAGLSGALQAGVQDQSCEGCAAGTFSTTEKEKSWISAQRAQMDPSVERLQNIVRCAVQEHT